MADLSLSPNTLTTRETAASAGASHAKALIEARYTVALARPRDMDRVRELMLKECRRPGFADSAEYVKPMGSKMNAAGVWEKQEVRGPSIRFAEAALRCMGNIVVDETTTYDDEDKRIVSITVSDLESNSAYTGSITIEKTVERKSLTKHDIMISQRVNSAGDAIFIRRATDDEITNKKSALVSKFIRNNVLRFLPGDFIDECMNLALKTQADRDAVDPDAARKKVIDAFAAINVSVIDLKSYVGVELSGLSPAQVADLRALHHAIKEGETSWRAAMESRQTDSSAGMNVNQEPDAAKSRGPGRPRKADLLPPVSDKAPEKGAPTGDSPPIVQPPAGATKAPDAALVPADKDPAVKNQQTLPVEPVKPPPAPEVRPLPNPAAREWTFDDARALLVKAYDVDRLIPVVDALHRRTGINKFSELSGKPDAAALITEYGNALTAAIAATGVIL